MNPAIVVPPPCVADCLPGFHNPPGVPCICVPNIPVRPPEQPVPTLETWALIGLLVILCSIAAIKLVRRPYE